MKAEIYWIEGIWPGRLGMMPRPRGGDWLADEMRSLRDGGVDVLVSALTEEEVLQLELAEEPALASSCGIEFVSFPIPDRGLPESRASAVALIKTLDGYLRQGQNVAAHCRAGIGRSALLAAALLVMGGLNSEEAFRRIETARGCSVPDTQDQKEWVSRFEREPASSFQSP